MEIAIIIWGILSTLGLFIALYKICTRSPENSVDLQSQLNLIIQNQNNLMKTLDEVLVSVTENETVGDSIVTLLGAIKKQLDDVLSGVNLPPAVQAKVDAIFDASERDKKKLQDAIVANTPSEPTEPPVTE